MAKHAHTITLAIIINYLAGTQFHRQSL